MDRGDRCEDILSNTTPWHSRATKLWPGEWTAPNAFGGSNYSNTPVGAISYVYEPNGNQYDASVYFGLWESGKNFAMCAWRSAFFVPYIQAVGDPFVRK